MLAKWATTLAGVAIFAAGAAYAESTVGDGVRTAPVRHGGGIWKAVVPPNAMQAEFGGHDPIGLASGAKIKADCSLNWIDPDTHKLYCFSSATSQSYFQDWPKRTSSVQDALGMSWRLEGRDSGLSVHSPSRGVVKPTTNGTAAKASLISMRSTSPIFMPEPDTTAS